MELVKRKIHLTLRVDKVKYKTRYATLGPDSFALYKKESDSLASQFVPTEKIIGAEIIGERSKKHVIKVILDKMEPIYFATDTPVECQQWASVLSRAKTLKDLHNWVIHPDLVKLETQIGVGAFGVVWRGSMSGAPVAVKEMRQSVGDDEVEKEIYLLGKIRNPYCVRLLGIYRNEAASKLFIVTEFVDGGDLSKAIYAGGPRSLSEEVKLKIIRDVARGIAFLHENSIIHRDLKTDNVLVRSTSPNAGQFAVVADFGISKIAPNLGEMGSHLTTGVGTPVYMAPECFQKTYTTQLDVYSFGVLMNEVFSEERPWSHVDTNFNSLIHNKVEEGERPRFNFTVREYPHCAEIQQIITGCWEGDPKLRWTMRRALEALDGLIAQVESNPNRPQMSGFHRAAPNSNAMHATHHSVPARVPQQSESLYSTFTGPTGSAPAGGYGTAYASVGAQPHQPPQHQPPPQQPPQQQMRGSGGPYGSTAGGSPYGSTAGGSPYGSTAGGSPYGSTAGGNPYGSTAGVQTSPYAPQSGTQAGYGSPFDSSAGGYKPPGQPQASMYSSSGGQPQANMYSSSAGGQGHPMYNQGSLYASSAGGYGPQTQMPNPQQPAGGLPNLAGLHISQPGGARPAAPVENDFNNQLIGFLESFGGEVPAPQVGQFLASSGVPPREAAIFADHLANIFSSGSPGSVTVNAILLMRQWFFPLVIDAAPVSDSMYESEPAAQSHYEEYAPPPQVGWRIPQINYLLGSQFFKAFMDGPTTTSFLKDRGTAPGQYIVRFSGTEAGKLALSALDNSMIVRHWKITLLPGGRVVESNGKEFDSIMSWIAFRRENPFLSSQGTVVVAITNACP